MLISAVLLVYATWRTANCVALAILIGTYQLGNDIRARRGKACIRICMLLQAFIHETDANSELQPQSSKTEVHFRHRVPYSSGWIASPATRHCLSWHWILWRLLPLKLSCWTMYGDLTAKKRNRTRMSLYRRVFRKLNRHILHWTQCTVKWSVTYFWYCRTAEDTLQRMRFWLLLTYLVVRKEI